MRSLESRLDKLEKSEDDNVFAALSDAELDLKIATVKLEKDDPESPALVEMKARFPNTPAWINALNWAGIYQWLGRDLKEIAGRTADRRLS